MHFEITPSHQTGKPLTTTQRSSGKFEEEPRIGTHVLRRGQPPLKLNEKQFHAQYGDLKQLFMAEAIEIDAVSDDGSRSSLRKAVEAAKKENGASSRQAIEKAMGPKFKFAADEIERLAREADPSSGANPSNQGVGTNLGRATNQGLATADAPNPDPDAAAAGRAAIKGMRGGLTEEEANARRETFINAQDEAQQARIQAENKDEAMEHRTMPPDHELPPGNHPSVQGEQRTESADTLRGTSADNSAPSAELPEEFVEGQPTAESETQSHHSSKKSRKNRG
jgi:hypothetical protein